jgi:hypothetical protein
MDIHRGQFPNTSIFVFAILAPYSYSFTVGRNPWVSLEPEKDKYGLDYQGFYLSNMGVTELRYRGPHISRECSVDMYGVGCAPELPLTPSTTNRTAKSR